MSLSEKRGIDFGLGRGYSGSQESQTSLVTFCQSDWELIHSGGQTHAGPAAGQPGRRSRQEEEEWRPSVDPSLTLSGVTLRSTVICKILFGIMPSYWCMFGLGNHCTCYKPWSHSLRFIENIILWSIHYKIFDHTFELIVGRYGIIPV